MRCEIVANTELPGNIVIWAETQAEILFLRQFARNPNLWLGNSGGNISESIYSILITHKKENKENH
jgi:hypothetical protein